MNMKNGKLTASLGTPLGLVIVVAAVAFCVELLFMTTLHEFLMPAVQLSGTAWDIVDAVTLTVSLAPALYFLVFRTIHENEQRFLRLNAAAIDAITIVNAQGEITDWNLAAQRMFQYQREEALGQRVHQLITPLRFRADAERGFALFQQTGGGPIIDKITETVALRKDGSEFPVELSTTAVSLKGHWHAIGIIRDITERKQAAQDLKKLSDRLQHILASTPAVHYACHIDGEHFVPTFASANMKAILGYDPAEYLGNAEWWGSNIHPEERDSVVGAARAAVMAADCSQYAHEYRVRRKDGTYRWVHDELQIIRDQAGQPLEIVGSWLDITERKLAEQSLCTERDFAQSIITTAQVIVLVLDSKGRIVSFNPYMENLSGWHLEEVRGKDWFSIFLPERDRKDIRKLFQTAISGTSTRGNVNALLTRDGRELQIEWFDNVLKDSKGEVMELIAIGQDVTQRLKTEAQLAEQLDDLRRFNNIMMDRETRIMELKHELNELLREAGQPPRYPSAESDVTAGLE